MKDIFTDIYLRNGWGDFESVSGPGSNLSQTQIIREKLPDLIRKFSVKTFLDIPCGDFNWMQEVELDIDLYIGADIVDEIVEINNLKYRNEHRYFTKLDLTQNPLPAVDLVFCRDCLVHLSLLDILKSLTNLKNSQSKYLLTTTFTQIENNPDIVTGGWRPLNFQKKPFCFPEPLSMINENCPTEGFSDKSLGLWKIADINPEQIYLNLLLESLAMWENALTESEENTLALNKKALILTQLGDWQTHQTQYQQALMSYKQAINCYTQALILTPNEANLHYQKGNILQKIGNLDELQSQSQQALQSYQEALACYNLATFFAPHLSEAYYHQGLALIYIGNLQSKLAQERAAQRKWQAALATFNQGLATAPHHALMRNAHDALQGFLENLHCVRL